MPDLIRNNDGSISTLAQNYRKTEKSSNFGTRKIAFYNFSCNNEYGLAANWAEPNSLYQRVVRALQQANVELFYVGQPRSGDEEFYQNWTGLVNTSQDYFLFAIKDDADNPSIGESYSNTFTVDAVNDYDQDVITITQQDIDGPGLGQPISFDQSVGGLVAGKTYYIASIVSDNTTHYITLSNAFDKTPYDISLPDKFGGIPLDTISLTNNDGVGAIATTKWNFAYWEGTAGDTSCSCTYDYVRPLISPQNFWQALRNDPSVYEIVGISFWLDRCQPTWGIFPAIYLS